MDEEDPAVAVKTKTDPLGSAQFLTVPEVAALARVSTMTIYRLIDDGTLSAVRVGRSVRVHSAAVRRYLRLDEQG